MKTLAKAALVAAIAAIVAVPVATPGYAHWSRYQHRHHAGVHHGYGAYAYTPRRHRNAGARIERDCTRSPASLHFVPCLNRP